MNIERNRLRTFNSWPANVAVEPQRIAKAGFFSTGQGLEVQCFSCGGKISEWNYGDQVMARHRVLDPRCPFVKNPTQSGNVPLIPGAEISTNQQNNNNNPSPSPAASQPRAPGPVSPIIEHAVTQEANTRYYSEAARLQSFNNWPVSFIVSPERLAKAGFFCLNQGDKVQCAFCSGIVGHWEAGDDPDNEHRQHFPTCPFVLNIPVGNIPLMEQPSTSYSQDRFDGLSIGTDMAELGIHTHRGPRHPEYSTVESRLRTYTEWPMGMQQSPQQLAQAGFYHVGVNDQVRCFHCDGGLRQWDPNDDPWTEHARWFSRCAFVRLVKGDDFIQDAIARRPPLLPADVGRGEGTTGDEPRQEPHKLRDVTEQELQNLMGMAPAIAALQVGLDASRIKMALRRKVEQTGLPFSTSDALIEAVLGIQMNEGGFEMPSRRRNHMASDTETESEEDVEDVRQVVQPRRALNTSRSLPSLQPPVEKVEQNPEQLETGNNAKSLPHLANDTDAAVSLEEENRRLKEARLCKICMDEEVGVVFLPCGHLVTCVNCAPSLHDCPVCRQPIKATVRTFLSYQAKATWEKIYIYKYKDSLMNFDIAGDENINHKFITLPPEQNTHSPS